jgi:hypothetical protein
MVCAMTIVCHPNFCRRYGNGNTCKAAHMDRDQHLIATFDMFTGPRKIFYCTNLSPRYNQSKRMS